MLADRPWGRRDISNTYEDPLARSVRRRLRLNGVSSGVPSDSSFPRKA